MTEIQHLKLRSAPEYFPTFWNIDNNNHHHNHNHNNHNNHNDIDNNINESL